MRRLAAGLVAASTVCAAAAFAVDFSLDLVAVDTALAIGRRGSEPERAAFHRPYRMTLGVPPVDDVEIITPFRRIALIAEERRLAGDLAFGQKQALAVARDAAGQLEIRVEISLHPLNTYVGLPDYGIALRTPSGDIVRASRISRMPRFGPRVGGQGLGLSTSTSQGNPSVGSQPVSGGTLIAGFESGAVSAECRCTLLVLDAGVPMAGVEARIDLGRLR